ncbi:MAG: RHS repeat protein, partial [Gammaproteobacteria bacterium]|nr:RHS repeat protein [Gammaproteobacteria bacterium]
PFAPVVVRHKNGLTEQFIPQLLGGHLEFIQDRNGNSVVLGYDMDERLATISDSTGARQLVINYSLTVPSLIESVVDPTGREVTYEYDASNRLATIYYPEGSTATYTYDASNRLDSYDDPRMPRGQAHLDVQYDGSNRAAHVEYTIDSFFDITYEVGGLAYTQWLDSEGSLHQVEYDPNFFNIVHDDTWISELGMWIGEAYSYYPNHMLQTKLDALDRLTVYDYDNWGNLTSIVDPMLAQTTFGYDPLFSNVISTTNPAGDMIQYFY